MTREPTWLIAARRHVGLAETPGRATTPTIRRWLIDLRAWWTDDETPWCGVAVAAWMREAGIELPRHWYRARAWLDWGLPLAHPAVGAVVVYGRGGGGHVGLIAGRDERGRLMTLGGNQGNRVSIAPFEPSRVLGYRWPAHRLAELQAVDSLPLLAANGQPSSHNEA
ncbi:MAG TPA: TIGR02594 family protein [Mycolicibacterium fallax]|nr:TIGR02594 family protein [Mycolicibacterium fallax]